jgi:hypothetical protein
VLCSAFCAIVFLLGIYSQSVKQVAAYHRHEHRDQRRHDRIDDYGRHPRYEHARPDEGYRPWGGGGESSLSCSLRHVCMPERP